MVLRQKGSDSINTTSNKRGDDIKTVTGQKLHKDCRRDYIHKRNIVKQEPSASTVSPVKARRSIESFNYKLHCIFCAQTAKLSGRKRGHDVYHVRMLEFQDSIEAICKERNDKWANQVLGRLKFTIDLPAAEAFSILSGMYSLNNKAKGLGHQENRATSWRRQVQAAATKSCFDRM